MLILFFNDTATTEIYTLSLHDALPIYLAVEEGEVFGFLGPNGAGKTTTVRTLLGFLKPTGGRGEVFGLDIGRESVKIRSEEHTAEIQARQYTACRLLLGKKN